MVGAKIKFIGLCIPLEDPSTSCRNYRNYSKVLQGPPTKLMVLKGPPVVQKSCKNYLTGWYKDQVDLTLFTTGGPIAKMKSVSKL